MSMRLRKVIIGLFEQSLVALLDRGIGVVPHIVMYPDHGHIPGEYDTLQIVSRCDIYALVVVLMLPAERPMDRADSPWPSELRQLLLHARGLITDKSICWVRASPAGQRGKGKGTPAFKCGLEGIVSLGRCRVLCRITWLPPLL